MLHTNHFQKHAHFFFERWTSIHPPNKKHGPNKNRWIFPPQINPRNPRPRKTARHPALQPLNLPRPCASSKEAGRKSLVGYATEWLAGSDRNYMVFGILASLKLTVCTWKWWLELRNKHIPPKRKRNTIDSKVPAGRGHGLVSLEGKNPVLEPLSANEDLTRIPNVIFTSQKWNDTK